MKPTVKVVFLRGSQCLGKTTFCHSVQKNCSCFDESMGNFFLSKDNERKALAQYMLIDWDSEPAKNYRTIFNGEVENLAVKMFESSLINLVGRNNIKDHLKCYPVNKIYLDNMHLSMSLVNRVKQILSIFKDTTNIEYEYHYMEPVPFDEVKKRNALRVGLSVVNKKHLHEHYQKYLTVYNHFKQTGEHI